MPEIRRHWRRKDYLLVPGGWTATVPQVFGESAVIDAYTAYFAADGTPLPKAKKLAEQTVQQTYQHGFVDGLREFTARRVREYAAMFPDLRLRAERGLMSSVWVCQGFDPEELQAAYVPFQNTGRAGLPFVQEMMREQGRRARRCKGDGNDHAA